MSLPWVTGRLQHPFIFSVFLVANCSSTVSRRRFHLQEAPPKHGTTWLLNTAAIATPSGHIQNSSLLFIFFKARKNPVPGLIWPAGREFDPSA